jgi:hypothetical protein
MAQAIVTGDAIHDLVVVVDTGAECDGDADERARHAEAATETVGDAACHRFKS